MHAIEIDADVTGPFRAARGFLAHPAIAGAVVGVLADYARPVTHRDPGRAPGRASLPVIEIRPSPASREMVLARWRYLGHLLATDLQTQIGAEPVTVYGDLSPADDEFFAAVRAGGLDLTLTIQEPRQIPFTDPEDSKTAATAGGLLCGRLLDRHLVEEFDRLIVCGDSWTCVDHAVLLEAVTRIREPRLALLVAQAYGLQGRTEEQRRLILAWIDAGGLPGVRAQHALVELGVPPDCSANDISSAEELLTAAATVLAKLPQSRSVRHQQIVNRHAHAMLALYQGDPETATVLLDDLTEDLAIGEWAGTQVHVIVLVNAGRAHTALGQLDSAKQKATQAAHLAPTHAPCHLDLARLRLGLGDTDGARQSAARACLLDPALPGARSLYRETLPRPTPNEPATAAGHRSRRTGEGGLLPMPQMVRRSLRVA